MDVISTSSRVISTDYNEALAGILGHLHLSAPWKHDEFVGACYMNDVKVTWKKGGDDGTHSSSRGSCIAYHLSSQRASHIDDAIIAIDYGRECHVSIIAPPRPILGYLTGPMSDESILMKYPIFDGATLKAYYFDGEWCLASRSGAYVNKAAVFTETFEDMFNSLLPVAEMDTSLVYVVSLTSAANCPYVDVYECGYFIEEVHVDANAGRITVTLMDLEGLMKRSNLGGPDSINGGLLGHVYRTSSGIYIDRSDIYAEIHKVIHDVPRQVLRRLEAITDHEKDVVRRVYIITRAILRGWDGDFAAMYPTYATEYISIRDYIHSLVRHIFTMCCTRSRNPDVLGSFVYLVAEKIGPLKTKGGRNIVVDTLFNAQYVEAVAGEYLKAMRRG